LLLSKFWFPLFNYLCNSFDQLIIGVGGLKWYMAIVLWHLLTNLQFLNITDPINRVLISISTGTCTICIMFSMNKTDCHNIAEILLKVTLNAITLYPLYTRSMYAYLVSNLYRKPDLAKLCELTQELQLETVTSTNNNEQWINTGTSVGDRYVNK
jgi:hypothetical protein